MGKFSKKDYVSKQQALKAKSDKSHSLEAIMIVDRFL